MLGLLSHWVCTSLRGSKDSLLSQRLVNQPGSPEEPGRAGWARGRDSFPIWSTCQLYSLTTHAHCGLAWEWGLLSGMVHPKCTERHIGATALHTAQSEQPLWLPPSLPPLWDVETLVVGELFKLSLLDSAGLGASLGSLFVDPLFSEHSQERVPAEKFL